MPLSAFSLRVIFWHFALDGTNAKCRYLTRSGELSWCRVGLCLGPAQVTPRRLVHRPLGRPAAVPTEPSANRIIPELQHIEVGDFIPGGARRGSFQPISSCPRDMLNGVKERSEALARR
jgi:hypothetical protein